MTSTSSVYFIQGVDSRKVKIGVATNISKRLTTLQTGSPERLELRAAVIGGQGVERHLHGKLAAHRSHGEWFSPHPEVLRVVAMAEDGELQDTLPDFPPVVSLARRIIAKFGGTRPLAAAIGVAPTTVQSWKHTGIIPAIRRQAVLDKAREKHIDLSPDDFFDQEAG